VHLKHDQAQDLYPSSHLTIDTLHQTQNAVKCFEYVNTTVGMRLDQRSYWDSWKLVGRSWRYRHKIWI